MSGFLPTTRPLSENYGPDVEDEKPIEDPTLETAASSWNKLKHDAAYAARMSPLLRVRVANSGAATVVAGSAIGPESTVDANVTVSRTSAGLVRVTLAAGLGISITDARVQAHGTGARVSSVNIISTTVVDVYLADAAGVATDTNFGLDLY